MRTSSNRQDGITLVELVVVLLLVGTLAAISAVFIVDPFQGAVDMRRRAELVDEAQLALERMAQEIRVALPNSVRIGDDDGVFALELVSTRTGGRYRRLPAPGGGGNPLDRAQSSDTFDVMGGLPDIGTVATGPAGTDCAAGNGDCINIFNTGQQDFDVYEGDNIAKIVGTTDNAGNDQMTYDNGGSVPAFNAHSPRQRFFVVDDVVSFVCDTNDDRLSRHAGYGLNATQAVPPGGTPQLMGRDVTACDFTYSPGTSTRAGLVTLDITIERDGETVRLLKQVHVMNAP